MWKWGNFVKIWYFVNIRRVEFFLTPLHKSNAKLFERSPQQMEKLCLVYKMNFILNTNIKSVSFLDTMNLLVDWYLVCDQCRPTTIRPRFCPFWNKQKSLTKNMALKCQWPIFFTPLYYGKFLSPPPFGQLKTVFVLAFTFCPPPTSEHSLSAFKLGSAAGFILKHRPNYIIYGWWCGLALPPFNIYNIHIDLKK